ncbi:cytochrome c oxidase assembly factor Coa1 family protein [Lacinutrix salivirga]
MEEHVQNKNWFGRNWKWVVPVGGCLTIIIVGIFVLGAAVFTGINAFKNATPYEHAVTQAKLNPLVQEKLGDSIDTYGMFSGNLNYTNGKSVADISIPIEGETGKGTLYVVGEKIDDQWDYDALYVIIKDTEEKIDLLETVSLEAD